MSNETSSVAIMVLYHHTRRLLEHTVSSIHDQCRPTTSIHILCWGAPPEPPLQPGNCTVHNLQECDEALALHTVAQRLHAPWIMVLRTGDTLAPHALEHIENAIRKTTNDWCQFDADTYNIWDRSTTPCPCLPPPDTPVRLLFESWSPPLAAHAWARSVLVNRSWLAPGYARQWLRALQVHLMQQDRPPQQIHQRVAVAVDWTNPLCPGMDPNSYRPRFELAENLAKTLSPPQRHAVRYATACLRIRLAAQQADMTTALKNACTALRFSPFHAPLHGLRALRSHLPAVGRAFSTILHRNRCIERWARRLRQRAQRAALKQRPLRIVLGASGHVQHGWCATEISELDITREDDWQRLLQPDTVDAMLSEHVLEHIAPDQLPQALNACYRYLRPGGRFRIAVPEGRTPDPLEHARIAPPAQGHRTLFTCESLIEMLQQAGFRVKPLEWLDRNGNFHCSVWSPDDGHIARSATSLAKQNGAPALSLGSQSLIVDAIKPAGQQ